MMEERSLGSDADESMREPPVRHRGRMRARAKTALVTLCAAAACAALGAVIVIRAGWYDVGAIDQHWQPTFSVLEATMRYSVRHHAGGIPTPPFGEALVRRGARVYRQACVQCHGGPGVAPDAIGLAMQPLPGPLVHMMRRWTPAEVYWIVANGIKMSGMPAWRYRLGDDDIWAVTAFVQRLPALSTRDYAALTAATLDAGPVALARMPDPFVLARPAVDPERGKIAIPQYACQSCHVIPGIVGGRVTVGPALDHYRRRAYIAGYLPNDADNLARWLRSPHAVKPGTAMPDLGVTPRDAADISAYILSDR